MEFVKNFGIPLIHPPEPAELPLCSIPVAVMIAIFGCQLATRDRINHLDSCHHLHREGQRRFPAGCETFLVLQVEMGGRSISYTCKCSCGIVHLIEHIWFDAAREI